MFVNVVADDGVLNAAAGFRTHCSIAVESMARDSGGTAVARVTRVGAMSVDLEKGFAPFCKLGLVIADASG